MIDLLPKSKKLKINPKPRILRKATILLKVQLVFPLFVNNNHLSFSSSTTRLKIIFNSLEYY